MQQVYYIVLRSWQGVLWKVIGWTENPYIAHTYFNHYKSMTSQLLEMRSVKCENIIEMARYIRDDIGTDIQDLLDTRLMTKLSKDEKCYVIYPSKCDDSFNAGILDNSRLVICICDYISKTVMTAVPLTKYMVGDLQDIISEMLYVSYLNTSVRKMLQRGPTAIPLSKLIDVVYFWRCLTAKGACQFAMGKDNSIIVPVEAVYIDVDYPNKYERMIV